MRFVYRVILASLSLGIWSGSIYAGQNNNNNNAAPPELLISEVHITFGDSGACAAGADTITILGTNFDNGATPTVVLGDGELTVCSATGDTIVAECPDGGLCADGDYLLEVVTGNAVKNYDEYDITIGAVGPQGEVGPAGADGADGADGTNGADGADGTDGADGADGAVGAQGPQGPQGPEGAEGPAGPAGEPFVRTGTIQNDNFYRSIGGTLPLAGVCDDVDGCRVSIIRVYGGTRYLYGPITFQIVGNQWWTFAGGAGGSASAGTSSNSVTQVILGNNTGSSFCYLSDWDTSGTTATGDQNGNFSGIHFNSTATPQQCTIKIED